MGVGSCPVFAVQPPAAGHLSPHIIIVLSPFVAELLMLHWQTLHNRDFAFRLCFVSLLCLVCSIVVWVVIMDRSYAAQEHRTICTYANGGVMEPLGWLQATPSETSVRPAGCRHFNMLIAVFTVHMFRRCRKHSSFNLPRSYSSAALNRVQSFSTHLRPAFGMQPLYIHSRKSLHFTSLQRGCRPKWAPLTSTGTQKAPHAQSSCKAESVRCSAQA